MLFIEKIRNFMRSGAGWRGGRQGLAAGKIHGNSSKHIENVGFQAKIMFLKDLSFSAASGMLLTPPGALQSHRRVLFHKTNIIVGPRVTGGRGGGPGTPMQPESALPEKNYEES